MLNTLRRRTLGTVLAGALLVPGLLAGCASVPSEVVDLSYTVGQDVRAVQQSYDALITARFDALRQQRIDYLNNEWIPTFLDDWVSSGRLIDTAEGKVVYSESENAFVTPDPATAEQQRLDTIRQWSQAAIDQINTKRGQLLDPLNQREQQIRDDMNTAFNQIISANAQVTANLASVRKVQDLQSKALTELGAQDQVTQLNQAISNVSEWAQKGLDEIKKADEKVN